jgi:hypothetical protein
MTTLMTNNPSSLATLILRNGHFGPTHGTTQIVLVLIGLAFAGLIVWAIERNGKATTR